MVIKFTMIYFNNQDHNLVWNERSFEMHACLKHLVTHLSANKVANLAAPESDVMIYKHGNSKGFYKVMFPCSIATVVVSKQVMGLWFAER